MTFFLDNCVPIKVGKILRAADQDVIILRERYPPDTPDEVWMPLVAREGWIVISDDNYIRRNPAQRQLLKELHLRVVFLPGPFAMLSIWQQVERIGNWWPKILKACAKLEPGCCLKVKMKSGDLELFTL